MSNLTQIIVQIRISWWFKYLYLPTLIFFCHVFDREVDIEKVNYWLDKAIKVE